jgi:hypothetical protein
MTSPISSQNTINNLQNFNFALKFQPQAFASLTLIAWGQTLYYHKSDRLPPPLNYTLTPHSKWRAWTATFATLALVASFALMELILILTLRGPYSRGVEWPMMLMAISASVIQVLGLIQPYFELAKRSGRVIGIDFWFLTIDYAGAFFSLMAVVAQQWFDALGSSLYIACLVLETGIFVSQALWMWRVRHVRCQAKGLGLTYDEFVERFPERCRRGMESKSEETIVDVEKGCAEEKDTVVKEEGIREQQHDAMSARSTLVGGEESVEAPRVPPTAVIKP